MAQRKGMTRRRYPGRSTRSKRSRRSRRSRKHTHIKIMRGGRRRKSRRIKRGGSRAAAKQATELERLQKEHAVAEQEKEAEKAEQQESLFTESWWQSKAKLDLELAKAIEKAEKANEKVAAAKRGELTKEEEDLIARLLGK